MSDRARNHPHRKSGAGMFGDKAAPARRCLMCQRKAKVGVDAIYVDNYGLCGTHDDEFGRRVAVDRAKKMQARRAIRPKGRKRV